MDMQVVLQNSSRVENPYAGNKLETQNQQFAQSFTNHVQKQQATVIKTASSDAESNINKDRHNKNEYNRKKRRQRDQNGSQGNKNPETSSFDATV